MKFGKYIRGDYTKLIIKGEVSELYYKDNLIAFITPSYAQFNIRASSISLAVYKARANEFCQEFNIPIKFTEGDFCYWSYDYRNPRKCKVQNYYHLGQLQIQFETKELIDPWNELTCKNND